MFFAAVATMCMLAARRTLSSPVSLAARSTISPTIATGFTPVTFALILLVVVAGIVLIRRMVHVFPAAMAAMTVFLVLLVVAVIFVRAVNTALLPTWCTIRGTE
jgi:hypothetical protein